MNKSFTLIELMVVISIIALLGALGMTTYSGTQQSARDTRRKTDLATINQALNSYYAVNNRYPDPNPGGAFGQPPCPNGVNRNCYVFSTFATNWIPALVPQYIEALPQDPINNATAPWAATDNYSYSYGNVSATGQEYDLTARLESTTDPNRCTLKQYKWWLGGVNSWCGTYSGQIYESSPNSF